MQPMQKKENKIPAENQIVIVQPKKEHPKKI
jgi:hypothetical protein